MGIQYVLLCEQNLSQLPWGREHFRVSSPCALRGMDYDAPPVENWGLSPPPLHLGRLVTPWDFPDSVITEMQCPWSFL